jgi:hypothetical protein
MAYASSHRILGLSYLVSADKADDLDLVALISLGLAGCCRPVFRSHGIRDRLARPIWIFPCRPVSFHSQR